MYLKGFQIRYKNEKTINLPKWDFGGDKSHTNKVWNNILASIRALPKNAYPLEIIDLDKIATPSITVDNKEGFENWLKNDFNRI